MNETVALTLETVPWSDEAAKYLARSTRKTPLVGAQDYRDLLAIDPTAHLYRGSVDGKIIGYAILRTERFAGGAEGVILAVAGHCPGLNLIDLFLPALEREFRDVRYFRFTTARHGLIKKMQRHGYGITHATLRKMVT